MKYDSSWTNSSGLESQWLKSIPATYGLDFGAECAWTSSDFSCCWGYLTCNHCYSCWARTGPSGSYLYPICPHLVSYSVHQPEGANKRAGMSTAFLRECFTFWFLIWALLVPYPFMRNGTKSTNSIGSRHFPIAREFTSSWLHEFFAVCSAQWSRFIHPVDYPAARCSPDSETRKAWFQDLPEQGWWPCISWASALIPRLLSKARYSFKRNSGLGNPKGMHLLAVRPSMPEFQPLNKA